MPRRLHFVTLWGAILISLSPYGLRAESRALHGHVPPATASLAPGGRLPAEQRINLALGLPIRNRNVLTNLLHALYDPTSAQYRQFLTQEQFTVSFGPLTEDYQAVV